MQNIAVAIGDVSILPVECYAVISAVLVPEAQRARSRRDSELLIEGAVSQRLVTVLLAIGALLWIAACECRMSPAVYKVSGNYRIVAVAVNYPWWKAAGLKSTVDDQPCVTRC